MLQITPEFKDKVVKALMERANFDGAESAYARQWGISASVFNRLKNGERRPDSRYRLAEHWPRA